MKRILLKSLPDPRFPDPRDPAYESNRIDYRRLIEDVVRAPLNRQTGVNMDEMRRGIRVLDALDRASLENAHRAGEHDVLELEDADWEHLRQKVEHFPWGLVDRRILYFHDDITNATDAVRSPAMENGRADS